MPGRDAVSADRVLAPGVVIHAVRLHRLRAESLA